MPTPTEEQVKNNDLLDYITAFIAGASFLIGVQYVKNCPTTKIISFVPLTFVIIIVLFYICIFIKKKYSLLLPKIREASKILIILNLKYEQFIRLLPYTRAILHLILICVAVYKIAQSSDDHIKGILVTITTLVFFNLFKSDVRKKETDLSCLSLTFLIGNKKINTLIMLPIFGFCLAFTCLNLIESFQKEYICVKDKPEAGSNLK